MPSTGDDALRLPAGVVTGEAVLLELPLASPMTRALALALDALILLGLGVALALLLTLGVARLDSDAVAAAALLGGVAIVVGVPTAWESASRGRSPGKAAAGLRVVRDDGGPIRGRQALVRALVGVGEIWLLGGSPALISSLVSRQGKRIGDLLAGTIVVRERAGGAAVAPPQMPGELAAWAARADIGVIPEDVAARARVVLGRGEGIEASARRRLLGDVTDRLRPLVAPPPPPGTAPEAFVAAVLAERRAREQVQWQRARARRDALAETARRLQGP